MAYVWIAGMIFIPLALVLAGIFASVAIGARNIKKSGRPNIV